MQVPFTGFPEDNVGKRYSVDLAKKKKTLFADTSVTFLRLFIKHIQY